MKSEIRSTCIYTAIMLAAIIAVNLLYGCTSGSSSWEKAKQADTYESYQNYIETHPEGEHLAEARNRADTLYWNSISEDTTTAPFETYLETFSEGQFRNEAQAKIDQLTTSSAESSKTEARVTGSNVIIRSDHTTASPSAGVVAKEGTVVQILDRYISGNSAEAVLKRTISVEAHNEQVQLPEGKAIRILEDRNESVRASFITSQFGRTEAIINKTDIEAISGERWYKIRTTDDITGWIYGKFIEEI